MRERLGQDLDCDITTELGVTGSIDLAHAAAADEIDQLKDADAGAGSQGQVVEV